MKRSAIDYLILICLLLAPLSLSMAAAQDQELLLNPGFEAPFLTSTDDPPRQVAEGWTRWHVPRTPGTPSYVNSDPEYYEVAPNADRIRSGANAQLISSLYAAYNGGVYQTVSGITPGTELRFSVYAWVWSTTFNEIEVSEEDGDLLVSVGIDPTGGTNGESTTIIWSDPVEAYDAYTEYQVEAPATSDTITVFVRATAGFPVRHNNVYLDDAALIVIEAGAETETVEPTEESTPEVSPTVDGSAPTDEVIPTSEAVTEEPTATIETPVVITEEPTAELTVTAATDPLPVPTEEPTAEPTATIETPVVITEEPTAEPTATIETPVVITEEPTVEPTVTIEIASATPSLVPPTSTSIPPAATATFTETTVPLPTLTFTPDPPTATLTETITPLPTLTFTPDPPTATLTETTAPLPTATFTGVPPTASPIATSIGGTPTEPGQSLRYTVVYGDTVARIAQRFNSTVAGIREANGLNANYLIFVGQELIIPVSQDIVPTSTPISSTQPTPVPTVQPPVGNTIIYVVQRGDSLYRIAQNFNTTIGTLAQINGIVNVSLLQIGQRLLVPVPDVGPTPEPPPAQPRVYIVQPGDTLYRLSLAFGVPVRQIGQVNGITQLNLIYVGQRLIIP